MRFGSLFAGVGGFDLGLERAGWSCAWQVEKDHHARAVLAQHWPGVPKHDDVCTVGSANLAPVDLVCGGFPCQDLSVAGKRRGLAGERSGLFWEAHRILAELRPRWVLLENVPGLLSSNRGRDLGAVLGALGDLGYWWTYRVLDSQHFGVPQRRRRFFLVGHLGAPCPPEVLLEPEGLCRHLAARREAWQVIASPLAGGARGGGGRRPVDDLDGTGLVVGAVCAKRAKGTGGPAGDEVQNIVCATGARTHALNCADGATEDGTGRSTPIVAFAENQRGELREMDYSPALTAGGGKPGSGYAAVLAPQDVATRDPRNITSAANRTRVEYGAPANTLHADGLHADGLSLIGAALAPRRLTPRECERLQGFPDDWAARGRYDGDEREVADSHRYRMMGNAVTVNVISWIAARVAAAHAGGAEVAA